MKMKTHLQGGEYIGQIILMPVTDRDISDYEPCDGRILDGTTNRYNLLYNVIEQKFGSDPSRPYSFALPDLRSSTPAGMLYYMRIQNGTFPPYK